ncbi:hypothetical protein DL769_008999 [Monosporascus sp. CRB-8-3]|nr:hypothetical protein DL769_008999 [Monosporascus sp. CRB-8-3]
MSSPLAFHMSSPISDSGRSRSQFTYRHLSLLSTYSTSSPLRVIAHIDLDAFYAQSRKFGIGRHCTVTEAKKLCPQLISQHVATWKEGDERWDYHDDAAAHIGTHKVSLDPYRLQSRKILALIKECLPQNLQKVEKASIDEVFLDLSAHAHSILLERFPELRNLPSCKDPTENLPLPPVTALDWQADALVDLDDADAETTDPDWDDVAILIGSEIVRDIRAEIRRRLGYTCSAGIANNKMLSKLGSGHKKPNRQTVIRNRAVRHFLSDMKFTKIRNLGGKLGDQVVSTFNTETVRELLSVPVEQMKLKLGDDTGMWLYNTIHGIDTSEVNSRTQIKSMLSAKSFRPDVNTFDQAVKWLRIFAADIFSRLVEEGVLENKRRPRTINLHHRHGNQTRSRSSGIPQGKILDEAALFDLAKNLLSQITAEGGVWPCANLSLSVSGFEDGITGNMGISSFLVKGGNLQGPKASSPENGLKSPVVEPLEKKRRVDHSNIQSFFPKRGTSDGTIRVPFNTIDTKEPSRSPASEDADANDAPRPPTNRSGVRRASISDHACSRCNARLETSDALQNHLDWHLAKDLHDEERGKAALASQSAGSRSQKGVHASSSSKRSGRGRGKVEHGQSKLKF